MLKNYITIPHGINYLSDYKGENGKDFELPNGILNKEITGCGGTTLALEDCYKTIICSPRLKMLECKHKQYPYAMLVIEGITSDQVVKYINTHDRPKILTSYDSFSKVSKAITDYENWRVVVDEFQCLLTDSSFKSETELKFLKQLEIFPYITYMSATPMLDKYVEQIDALSKKPYYKLQWTDKEKTKLIRYKCAKPIDAAIKIVRDYKNGVFPFVVINGEKIESKEAVIFLNSVQNICNIVKQCKLSTEDVNIIVGSNEENDALLSKIPGGEYKNSNAPLKGENHKLITLCTSTAYMGVDFYSTCASTFVISDCTRKNTAIDITTELTQIAGRQRLAENPFRNLITFIYNTTVEDMDEDAFKSELDSRMMLTKEEVNNNNACHGPLREKRISDLNKLQKMLKYGETFTYYDNNDDLFKVNRLAYLSELFNYDVQQNTYRSGLLINKCIDSTKQFEDSEERYAYFEEHVNNTIARTKFEDIMRTYCDYRENPLRSFSFMTPTIEKQHPELSYYYETIGPKKLKALGYKEKMIIVEIKTIHSRSKITRKLCERIELNKKYSADHLKTIMAEVYNSMSIKATGTVSKLEKEYGFKVVSGKETTSQGRRNYYQIVRKPQILTF